MTIIVKFGGEIHEFVSINQPTVGDVINNPTTRAVLGYGDNVRGLVDGVEMTNDVPLADRTELRIETRANQKAK